MTKVQNPIIGRSKGQAGGMVFTTLYGKNVMKAKPYSYRDANTEVQQDNRSLHLALVRAAASQKLNSRSLFHIQPADMSAYAKTIQQLQKSFNHTVDPPTPDFAGAEIGSGNFELEIDTASYNPITGVADITYTQSFIDDVTDLAIVPDVYCFDTATNTLIKGLNPSGALSTGAVEFDLPTDLTSSTLYVVVAYSNQRGGSELAKNVKRWFSAD
jgi:hypothetical protein